MDDNKTFTNLGKDVQRRKAVEAAKKLAAKKKAAAAKTATSKTKSNKNEMKINLSE